MLGTIMQKTIEHLYICFTALALAITVATFLALGLTRMKNRKLAALIMRAVSVIQTMPGLAMMALIVVLLVSIRKFIPIPTTGLLPGVLALFLYAVPPILTNMYTGVKQTGASVIDVARGLGMTRKQILFSVEIPTAVPMIMAGIRIAGIWTIGMGTLASLVGSGGLGDLIVQGLRSMNVTYVFAGTIPAAILALVYDWGMTRIEQWLKVDH